MISGGLTLDGEMYGLSAELLSESKKGKDIYTPTFEVNYNGKSRKLLLGHIDKNRKSFDMSLTLNGLEERLCTITGKPPVVGFSICLIHVLSLSWGIT